MPQTPQTPLSSPALRAVARRLLPALSAAPGRDPAHAARATLWAQVAHACAFADDTLPSFFETRAHRQLALVALPALGARLAGLSHAIDPAVLLGQSASPAAFAARSRAQSEQSILAERDEAAVAALRDWLARNEAVSGVALMPVNAILAPRADSQPAGSPEQQSRQGAQAVPPLKAAPAKLGQRLAAAHLLDSLATRQLQELAGPGGQPGPSGPSGESGLIEPDWKLLAQAGLSLAADLDRELLPVGAPFRQLMGNLALLGAISDRSPPLAWAFSQFGAISAQIAAKAARAFLSQDPHERETGPSGALLLSQLAAQEEMASLAVSTLREAYPRASDALRAPKSPSAAPTASAAPSAADAFVVQPLAIGSRPLGPAAPAAPAASKSAELSLDAASPAPTPELELLDFIPPGPAAREERQSLDNESRHAEGHQAPQPEGPLAQQAESPPLGSEEAERLRETDGESTPGSIQPESANAAEPTGYRAPEGSLIREPLQRLDKPLGDRSTAFAANAQATARASALSGALSPPASSPFGAQSFWGDPQAAWAAAAQAGLDQLGEREEVERAQSIAQDPQAWKGLGFGVLAWADRKEELINPNRLADWVPFALFLLSGAPFGGVIMSVLSGICFFRPARRCFSSLGRAGVALWSSSDTERKLLTSAPGWNSFLFKNVSIALILLVVNVGSCMISQSLMGALGGMGGGGSFGNAASQLNGNDMKGVMKALGQ